MPPTKRTEMKKSLYSLFAVLAIFCACQDENSQLGKSLVESSFYNVYADTCSVDISTILLDSIETRGDSICQLGHYRSSAWGEVSATYYAEYSTSDFTPNTDYTYTLDSLVLRMIPSGHFWGRYPDATAHLHLPAEKPYRAGQRRGPLQQHRTPDGRYPALQLYLHPLPGAEEGSKRPPARLMGTTTAE